MMRKVIAILSCVNLCYADTSIKLVSCNALAKNRCVQLGAGKMQCMPEDQRGELFRNAFNNIHEFKSNDIIALQEVSELTFSGIDLDYALIGPKNNVATLYKSDKFELLDQSSQIKAKKGSKSIEGYLLSVFLERGNSSHIIALVNILPGDHLVDYMNQMRNDINEIVTIQRREKNINEANCSVIICASFPDEQGVVSLDKIINSPVLKVGSQNITMKKLSLSAEAVGSLTDAIWVSENISSSTRFIYPTDKDLLTFGVQDDSKKNYFSDHKMIGVNLTLHANGQEADMQSLRDIVGQVMREVTGIYIGSARE